MTRKEELAARARDYVSLFVMSGAEPAATKNLAWMLEQVEREVWEKVEKQARDFSVLYPMDVWRDSSKKDMTARIMVSFADWLREKQQELGS